ncbi:hypothetical protein M993_02129 [Obesumbacterium proteus ATCC 12841]|uniref:EAL domain-containing protein n=1 Tax=Obesumbacterium proteus ATCC 12841 TaxID=1354268 RepID=A0AA91EK16_9GAMM|nr:hypothetical protein M993_02129 [Obesumbacterium proteus ATCC 12841]
MTLSLDHDLLRSDISIRYVFQKMFSSEGTLVAVECLSRFDHISVSPEDFFRYASAELRESIFMEQLALIDKHKQWFNIHGISATINVDDHILNVLLRPEVKAFVEHIGCVHFEVTEASNKLLNNALVTWGKAHSTTLWLDDFGSGNANINAFRGYHFNYVKIDKDFFWHLIKKESGRPLMDALVTFFPGITIMSLLKVLKVKRIRSGCKAWSGLQFRATTGRKSALKNWSKKRLSGKEILEGRV